ncbi:MAG: non-homologous end-joining DNA ligase [Pyrinomonadaceae bacterium]
MGLEIYQRKRDFTRTPEPRGKISKLDRRRFVVQEHHASKLHFDFRLEMGGVLKSWSVPRGPSLDPVEKRLAVPTEDHPVEYLTFEGYIPEGNYGAGEHMRWDAGTYKLLDDADATAQLEAGKINFTLEGDKLRGAFSLVRMKNRGDQWLLMKKADEHAVTGWRLELRQMDDEAAARWLKDERARDGARKSSTTHAGQTKKLAPPVRLKKAGETTESKGGKAVVAAVALKSKHLAGDMRVRVGRAAVVPLTNLDKVYWPDDGYTKGDLVRYYYEVSGFILPYLKDRPLIMKRYPEGIAGPSFHQHDVNVAPDFVRTERLDVEEGHPVDYIIGDDAATLLYMANLGAIERHTWHSRVRNLDRPDWIVFDLDPGAGIEFKTICALAVRVRDALARLGLNCYPKTSGSRGIHVYVPIKPIYDYERAAEFAANVATLIARENNEIATIERALKKRRQGQIYLDHMQNARGKSVVAPYSVRPKPGASVSAPLEWKEVEGGKITPGDFTIKNVLRRVARKGDLFKPVLAGRQTLDDAHEEVKKLLRKTKARGDARR